MTTCFWYTDRGRRGWWYGSPKPEEWCWPKGWEPSHNSVSFIPGDDDSVPVGPFATWADLLAHYLSN